MAFRSTSENPLNRIAAACLAGISLLALGTSLRAQTEPRVAGAPAQSTVSLSVPAGSLEAGLLRLGRETNLRLIYPSDVARGKTTAGVSGNLPPQEALSRLLAGTGLTYRFTSANTVTIIDPSSASDSGTVAEDGSLVLDTITVQGQSINNWDAPPEYAGGQVAAGARLGMLGNKSIMDTPFSITSYTEKTIANQQAKTIADVMANEPTVHVITSGLTSSQGAGDWFTIRGHTVSSAESSFNGLSGILSGSIFPVETVDRIEVLRGPSALLNGQLGTLGGTINIVPKRATADPITRLTADYTSTGLPGGHVDLGRRFGTNHEWGVRLNGAYRNGSTAIERQSLELGLGSIALDYMGERFRSSFDAGYLRNYTESPNYGYAVFAYTDPGLPKPPNASKQFGLNWAYSENEYKYAVAKAEYDLIPSWTLYGTVGVSDQESDRIYITPSVLNFRGLANISAGRMASWNKKLAATTGIRGSFETGLIKHELNVSATINHTTYGWDYGSAGTIGQWNIYESRPNFRKPSSFPQWTGHQPKTTESTFSSIAIADTFSFWDDKIAATLGVRYQTVDVTNWDRVTLKETSSYKSNAVTPALALVWRPTERLSLYGNYIEGLTQGSTAPSTATNAGEVFPPYITKQIEAGIKYDFGTFATTLSAYQMEKQNLISTPDPTSGLYTYSLDGEQRHRGVELTVFGELYSGLRLMGGVAYNDAQLLKTQGGTLNGNTVNGVPYLVGKFGVEWDTPFIQGLTITGRLTATSEQYLTDANTKKLPSWASVDLGAQYRTESFGHPLTLRASVENVFDTNYWASVNSNNLTLGAPRTFKLSATVDF